MAVDGDAIVAGATAAACCIIWVPAFTATALGVAVTAAAAAATVAVAVAVTATPTGFWASCADANWDAPAMAGEVRLPPLLPLILFWWQKQNKNIN